MVEKCVDLSVVRRDCRSSELVPHPKIASCWTVVSILLSYLKQARRTKCRLQADFVGAC